MEPYKQVFTLPNGASTTSLVVDQDEFESVRQSLPADIKIQAIEDKAMIPWVDRSPETEAIFIKYDVKTDILTVAMRGVGNALLGDPDRLHTVLAGPEFREQTDDEYDRLPAAKKADIEAIAMGLFRSIREDAPVLAMLDEFLIKYTGLPKSRREVITKEMVQSVRQTLLLNSGRPEFDDAYLLGYLRRMCTGVAATGHN
jgi:hypothetical protein